jgi:hypothetical protein
MSKWIPVTNWTKITEEEAKELRATPYNRPGWLREFCHCCREWFVRHSVEEPEAPVWYHDPANYERS